MDLVDDAYNQPLSDQHLNEISNSHCAQWKHLYPHLGLEKAVCSDVEESQEEERTKWRNFLMKWKEIKGGHATYKALISALQKAECQDDAEFVCRLVKPETASTQASQSGTKQDVDPLDMPLKQGPDLRRLCSFLRDLSKDDIVKIGTSLGLDYTRLCGLSSSILPHEMIQWWLGIRDSVKDVSGTPTLRSLIKALEENGFNGHAKNIRDCSAVIPEANMSFDEKMSTDELCAFLQCNQMPKSDCEKIRAKEIGGIAFKHFQDEQWQEIGVSDIGLIVISHIKDKVVLKVHDVSVQFLLTNKKKSDVSLSGAVDRRQEASLNPEVCESQQPSDEVMQDLRHKLRINWRNIGDKFASFTFCICTSLNNRNITAKNLTTFLLKLPALKEGSDEKQHKLLAGLRTELKEADNINDIINLLDDRCASVLDYHVFQSIVEEFKLSTEENKEKLDYPKHLKHFIEMHKLSEFIQINPKLGKHTEDCEKVSLKFDSDLSTCKLSSLIDLKSALADILDINPSTLRLFSVTEGCVEITFLISSLVANFIFTSDKIFSEVQVQKFITLKAKWLKCCGYSYNFEKGNPIIFNCSSSEEQRSGKKFGQKRPPLFLTIRQILERYPDGQIFKEMIQNADDAGATIVQFYVDCRQHGRKSLVKSELAHYQGPALISANDAMFSAQDWEEIQNLKQSDGPFKVGHFGIGFNSVYHLTDVPSIVSGKRVAFLEPQEHVWKGESGRSFVLAELSGTDHLTPIDGIAGFTSSTKHYPKTLFRFPLRTNPSGLSENVYSIAKVNELIDALRSEAKFLLLFLRSITTIEVYNIDQNGQQDLSFQVKVVNNFVQELKRQRFAFLERLSAMHASQKYDFRDIIRFAAKFDVFVYDASTESCSTSHWLVANRVDSTNPTVRAASVKQKVFPWVGTAVELDNPGNGRIFCFLPMPIEIASNLPIHINGTFGLNDDRRSLKWPGVERKNDPTAAWNELLVNHVIPACYVDLLLQAKCELGSGHFYDAWPSVKSLSCQWQALLSPIFQVIFREHVIWCEAVQEWVVPSQAVYLPTTKCGLVVERALTKCGVKLAECPSHVKNAISSSGLRVTEVSPNLARDELRKYAASYTSIDPIGKNVLLKYCLKDGHYSELSNLYLLPLANGDFIAFNQASSKVYICTQECPKYLLPNLENRLVDIQHDSELQSILRQVAKSNYTQLKELTVPDIASLLHESMPREWQHAKSVTFPNSSRFPSEWFPKFWKWAENKSLKTFANCLILPVRVKDEQHLGHFKVVTLNTQSLLYGSSCSDTLLSLLCKFDINCCVQTQFSYVTHRELKKLKTFDVAGILYAISRCPRYDLTLTSQEAESLRTLLGSTPYSIQTMYYSILGKLKMFLAKSDSSRLYSIEEVSSQSLLRTPLALNSTSTAFDISTLPPNIILFSADNYYQNQILQVLSIQYLNASSFLKAYIFPRITNGSISESYIDGVMLEVLKKFESLNIEDRGFSNTLAHLAFVKTSSGARQSPSQLFDPANEEMSKIFAGQNVFPATLFDHPDNMRILRACGLRTSVTAQEIVDIIQSFSPASTENPQQVDAVTYSKSKAILQYIGRSAFLTQYRNTQCTLSRGWYQQQHFFPEAVRVLSTERAWLPVSSCKPDNYPSQLPWKGEEFTSHLCSLNSTVSISSTSKPSHALLYGSQMYFTEPVIESDVLTSEESPAHLVAHLQVLISQAHSFTPEDMIEILHKLYSAMSQISHTDLSSLRTIEKWVYIKSSHAFVSPSTVALQHNPSFRHNLEPYLHTLPDSLSSYSQLFTSFGVSSVFTEEQILSIMAAIKEDISHNSMSISEKDSWSIVMAILNWLTENGTKDYSGSLENVFVPTESDSEWPDLQPALEVTYTDNEFMKKFTLSSESEKPLVFIHDRVGIKIAEHLQLVPLSQELDIAADTFEDTGQYEPLTTRLKNILRDYKDGLTIVKELIQNADDAEATEVNICYDTRTHSKEKDKLFFAGMAESHGPALVIHNNKVFSDEDFENITTLAGATKQKKHLKIGKFGIGFCSVYHITDIPSFLSRDRLCIFDPTLAHLGKEVKNPALPGKRLKFNSRIIQNSKQLEPYQSLFGFNGRESYQGTMFRLPFRTAPSELSGKCYSEDTALELLEDIYNCSENLILFLQHVQTITFQRIDTGDTHPTTLCTVKRGEIALPPSVHLNCTSALVINSSKQGESKSSKWLVSKHTTTHSEKDAVANVACQVNSVSDGSYTLNSSLNGEIFCYLPLAQSTGLPVHVSCNFAVINNRRGIWTADESTAGDEDEVQWNDFLMENVIPQAYSSLLYCLKCLQQNGVLKDYVFHELWPLTAELKQHNPWYKFVQKLYEELAVSTLFFTKSREDWRLMNDSNFLQPNILSRTETPSYVFEVLYHCNYPIVDLPSKYRTHFALGNSLVSELHFIELFFDNFTQLANLCSSRNLVVQHMLELYASECDSNSQTSAILKQYLSSYACIPCSPDGIKVRMVTDLIHPAAPFAKLYDPDEAKFPLEDLVSRNLPELALKKLGIISEKIPWSCVAERAQTIQTLVNSSSAKGYNSIEFIIDAVTFYTDGQPPTGSNLDSIMFLPVMKKPPDFPLSWPGEGTSFSCGKQMIRTGPKPEMPNVKLAGSQLVFVDEAPSQDKGCSHISDRAEAILGLSSEPLPSAVLAHFTLLIKNAETLSFEWISKACEHIYDYLEKILKSKKATCDFTPLNGLPCVWTGNKFIFADQVSFNWSINGPYLYKVPTLLRGKPALCSELHIKENFSICDIKQCLTKMEKDFSGSSIDSKSQTVFNQILPLLYEFEFKDGGIFLPDENYVLYPAENMAYNDAPWAPQDNTYTYAHEIIPRGLARKIGVKPVRSKFLDKYSSVHDFQGGVEFGQREDLTRRIKNILRDYPLDVTLLKELLQNADDAKATKMYVILDKRTHGKRSVLSEEWQDLQGPALLVWNDSVFSERDLEGIQQLGLGSKRSEAETIGQYGIGFNVVYHITDCPSFVTNDKTLCIMDPHCRYVPWASLLRPGRRFDRLNQGFWNDFPDIKSAYLRHGIDSLPQEVLGGSLFRFPIRHDKRNIAHSEITEDPEAVLNANEFCEDLCSWMKNMKEAMLFLNNVSELKLFTIDEKSSAMKCVFYFQSKNEIESNFTDRTLLQTSLSSFKAGRDQKPCVIMYPLTLIEVEGGGDEKVSVEKWLIQQGVGDISNSGQVWQYVDTLKPRHGIAAPVAIATKQEDFNGQVFCFLPIPVKSGLPVHVNGHFILNSTRRELWTSTDINRVDDRSKWNSNLVQALSSSYAEFLLRARNNYVSETYENIRTALSHIEHYYSLFPNISSNSSLWNTLAHDMYSIILQCNHPIFCVLKSSGSGYITEWYSPKSLSPANHVYFWEPYHYYSRDHKDMYPILERIGMKITPSCSNIMSCFNKVLKESKSQTTFSSVTRQSIFDYYTKHSAYSASSMKPTAIEETSFHDVSSFVLFTKYLLEEEKKPHQYQPVSYVNTASTTPSKYVYPNSPFSHYLLLTADGVLRKFEENNKVLKSPFCHLFPNSFQLFLHPSLLNSCYTNSYFILLSNSGDSRVTDVILHVMDRNFPQVLNCASVVDGASDIISDEQLKALWQCFSEDKVFKVHIPTILLSWALLLTEDDRLFSISSNILPVCNVHSADRVIRDMSQVMKAMKLPFLRSDILGAESVCPSLADGKRILSYLFYVNATTPLLFSLNNHELNVIIDYFDHYLQLETHDSEMVQSLPLFEKIDGTYTSIWGRKAYIWPSDACSIAHSKWMEGCSAVFLKKYGKWCQLKSPEKLPIYAIATELLYAHYIFPNFHKMNCKERYQHLKYIRVNLYQTYKSNSYIVITDSSATKIIERKRKADTFIDALKKLKCIGSDSLMLREVSAFRDHTLPIFQAFSTTLLLPEELRDLEWLDFFKDVGLRQIPSRDDFIQFCHELASIEQNSAMKASATLLQSISEIPQLHEISHFLRAISDIPIVFPESLSEFNWLLPSISSADKMVRLKDSAPLDGAPLVWTIKPIVRLPKFDSHTLFLFGIGIKQKDVIANLTEISKSPYAEQKLFSKYPVNMKCPDSGKTLFQIMSAILSYFKGQEGFERYHVLQSLPCVPVHHTTSSNASDANAILVKPCYVIKAEWNYRSEVNAFHPFLHCLSEKLVPLYPFLQLIGIQSKLELRHFRLVLERVFEDSAGAELDPNNERCVQLAINKLFAFLKGTNSLDADKVLCPLYLPNAANLMTLSTDLVYSDDTSFWGTVELDESSKYSLFNITTAKYQCTARGMCDLLPEKLRPIGLSTIHTLVINDVFFEQDSEVTKQLKKALSFDEISEGIALYICTHVLQKPEDKDILKKAVKEYLSAIDVVTVSKLKPQIMLTESSLCSGTLDIKFCYVPGDSGKKSTLYLDKNLLYPVDNDDAYLVVANHLCDTLCLSLGDELSQDQKKEISSVIKMCFKAKSVDDVHTCLSLVGINLINVTMHIFSKKIGEEIPNCWHHRLDQDINNVFNPME